ncbi:MAG TPA: transglutaminase-like domain-containing protein, partial [Myxococcota bacterium]|nr:transglutaminase-like domain-containing protein [Myxococcota bacterium]
MSVEVLSNPTVSMGRKRVIPPESLGIQIIKALLYMVAFGAMHLWRPVATDVGLGAFAVAVIAASVFAQRAFRSEMRPVAVLLIGLGFAFIFQLLSGWVRTSTTIAPALGVDGAIYLSDILAAGLAALSVVFVLRFFAKRHRAVAILELCVVVLIASYALLEHRGFQINRPHWFADWIFSMGMDPVDLLKAFGVGLMVLGLVMALQRPGANKGWMSFIVASAIALAVFFYLKDRAAPAAKPAPTAGLLGEGEDGEAEPDEDDSDGDGQGGGQGKDGDKGGGGGSGKSDSPFGKNNKRPPPQPVALVTFHDDFESKEPILYFRQNAQSRFDQTHLTVDPSGRFDDDLITRFPTSAAPDASATSPSGPIAAKPRDPTFFKRVPTSMFLITDHPQPVTLGHAAEVRPLDNPNPNLFVASYEVTSDMLVTEWSRLVGRSSVPDSWDEERREHYTSYPDDPRYQSLADEILRDIDPRYQDDDLVRAFAIKRYLEKNGFYTLKETHKDSTDPTASFLFGSLRGYCVHFAHAAVFLMRSQGIAARVAVGYAVDTARRGSGSSLLILGDMAHAWPEIHLDGVGWVTFDVYPEQSDEPPPTAADQDLASVL